MLEQFMKNCSLWERPMLEKFVKDCLPWVGSHIEAGEEHEEEGAAETTCNELTTTPIPHPPGPRWGRSLEKRRLRGDLAQSTTSSRGGSRGGGADLLTLVTTNRT
ncbi:hypothetical protein QYF61_012748 [Mycteria americana]|uniref:Uncharacterized protein n=1 Tax=Mycteria americana TaxID=33587 RepID=A0AAN7NJ01_MYCAM|nr:hypothetical protein QYF61_012748 [Mycteria americana]